MALYLAVCSVTSSLSTPLGLIHVLELWDIAIEKNYVNLKLHLWGSVISHHLPFFHSVLSPAQAFGQGAAWPRGISLQSEGKGIFRNSLHRWDVSAPTSPQNLKGNWRLHCPKCQQGNQLQATWVLWDRVSSSSSSEFQRPLIIPGPAKGCNQGDAHIMKLLGKLVFIIKQVCVQNQNVCFFLVDRFAWVCFLLKLNENFWKLNFSPQC